VHRWVKEQQGVPLLLLLQGWAAGVTRVLLL
jgi:hypothetical protein